MLVSKPLILFIRVVCTFSLFAAASPVSHAEHSAFAQRLSKTVDSWHQRGLISGVVKVVTPTESYFRAVGLANDKTSAPNDAKTIFNIASNGKQFISAAIFKLRDLELLTIDDPVSKYFPEYPVAHLTGELGNEVTIKHLLQNTSGLVDVYEEPSIKKKMNHEPISFDDVLAAFARKPLVTDPGQVFEYNDTGFILAGEIVRRVSGLTLAQFLSLHFFKPLKLKDTSVDYPLGGKKFARSYEGTTKSRHDYFEHYGITTPETDETFADGNIFSTAEDLTKWLQALGGGKVFSAETTTEYFSQGQVDDYGFGWVVENDSTGRRRYKHTGSWLGYESFMAYYPEEDISIVWTGNQSSEAFNVWDYYEDLSRAVLPKEAE